MMAIAKIAVLSAHVAIASPATYADMWKQFKLDFGKSYENNDGDSEEERRFQIFKATVDHVQENNAKNLSYSLGINHFADMTTDEFESIYGCAFTSEPETSDLPITPFPEGPWEDLPDAIDWVHKGAVTPVKNQGACGSCWTFSVTGVLEAAVFFKHGQLPSLSEEELVQCDMTPYDNGCKGGSTSSAMNWIHQNGLCSEHDYPYTSGGGVRGGCHRSCKSMVSVASFSNVPKTDPDLRAAVARGPVSVLVFASQFMAYRGGVWDSDTCPTTPNHAMLAVGYGVLGKPYWRVKNSWSQSWGEGGYISMARGKNLCGIASYGLVPQVTLSSSQSLGMNELVV